MKIKVLYNKNCKELVRWLIHEDGIKDDNLYGLSAYDIVTRNCSILYGPNSLKTLFLQKEQPPFIKRESDETRNLTLEEYRELSNFLKKFKFKYNKKQNQLIQQ